jgi:hypothetical protein
MKSIPFAITWELLWKNPWNLIAGFLCANSLPALLFSALQKAGVDFQDTSMIMIHSTLLLTNICIFAVSLFSVQGSPSRLYGYPIKTSTLVACHLIPTMVLTGLEMLLSTVLLNQFFDARWPLWSAALFAAAALPLIQATVWFTEKSAWLPWAIGLVSGVLGVWYHYRFSHRLFNADYNVIASAPLEGSLLVLTAVVSFVVGGIAMARNRCGERLKPLGISAWICRRIDFVPRERPPFRSAAQAQLWAEWRVKGWAMPVSVVFGLMIGLTIWVMFVRNPEELVIGFMSGGGLLSAVAVVWAIIIGNVGPMDKNLEMGHFLASRPMTSKDMARTILTMTAQSTLLSWTIWVGTFLVAAGILFATGKAPHPFFPMGFSWWYFPLTLVSCWTVVSVLASIGLTGRSTLCAQLFLILFACYFGGICVSVLFLSEESEQWLVAGAMALCSVVFLPGTAFLYVAAWKRNFIEIPTMVGSFCIWMMLAAGTVTYWLAHPTPNVPVLSCVLLVSIEALVVAPLAATPLALAWNRTR